MYRIFSECQLHSATGRVSLSEPNLQNIPKDFEIKMPGRHINIDYVSFIAGPHSAVSTRRARGPKFDIRSGYIILFLLPLIQEGELSVTGESMCT